MSDRKVDKVAGKGSISDMLRKRRKALEAGKPRKASEIARKHRAKAKENAKTSPNPD